MNRSALLCVLVCGVVWVVVSAVQVDAAQGEPSPAADSGVAGSPAAAADHAATESRSAERDFSDFRSTVIGLAMLGLLLAAFVSMTAYDVPLPLAMALTACAFLALQGKHAAGILQTGFMHFSDIVVLFTAVAIPAHMIERSQGFKWAAAWAGFRFGRMRLRRPRLATPAMIVSILLATYVTAALMHNVTSILIMTPIIIRLCDSYGVPSRWVLCGALVASNLGGFSTRWGDTPNIIESATWKLTAADFLNEVVPANLIVLAAVSAAVVVLTNRALRRSRKRGEDGRTASGPQTIDIALGAAGWKESQKTLHVDRRLLGVGLAVLASFIVLHVVFDEYKIAIGGAAILICILADRPADRFDTLKSLGYDVYLAFAAIFVMAGCFEHSWVGFTLRQQILAAEAAPWAIAITGYLGTMFTEAASWATAASTQIYTLGATPGLEIARSHAAAWALGGGICAGSSSLITAASAGIVLAEESARFKDDQHTITFRRYLPFGIGCSLFMLLFYAVYFSLAS